MRRWVRLAVRWKLAHHVPMAERYRSYMRHVVSDFACIAHLVAFPPITLWRVQYMN